MTGPLRWCTRLLTLLFAMGLMACAGPGTRTPVSVDVVGVEPLPSQGLEGRFMVKLRVQNPNDQPIEYDGVHVELQVRGMRLASGVSAERGIVGRFGESVLSVPVTVPPGAVIRQVLGLVQSSGKLERIDYTLTGKLNGPMFGGVSFRSSGELALPGASGAVTSPALPAPAQ